MMRFSKSFTLQEPLCEAAIERAVAVMRSGRLHRYGAGEASETAALEREFAAYQGARYALACASGGQAMQIALRAIGVKPGDRVLMNAYTLAPVPGALAAIGAEPALVEIDEFWRIDLADLEAKADRADVLLLSHMRGHIADMNALMALCDRRGIEVIEDCAHTMGARVAGAKSGSHGAIACFSTQTYKHLNSGEGGLLTTDDDVLAARAILLSGSYMLFERHGAAPPAAAFEAAKWTTPNGSARMDELRAAILRPQLARLDRNVARWRALYDALAEVLRTAPGLRLAERREEVFVGSSLQFRAPGLDPEPFLARCAQRGVELKWFGRDVPDGFTSRFDHWRHFEADDLPRTRSVLADTFDLRLPLTFDTDDCRAIGAIIREEAAR